MRPEIGALTIGMVHIQPAPAASAASARLDRRVGDAVGVGALVIGFCSAMRLGLDQPVAARQFDFGQAAALLRALARSPAALATAA